MYEITDSDREILSILMELSKAIRCCRQDEIFCEDVTFTQFIILDAVARDRVMNMSDLHGVLSVDKSTTTRLIAPLLKRHLLTREKAGHDSRAAVLRLTEVGREIHENVWLCLFSFIRAIHEELPPGKKDAAFEGIRLFLNTLQNVSSVRCSRDKTTVSCRCSALKENKKELTNG